ncbi:hypothetical protein MBLNU457_4759t2 [Dothideomycetes sp. NU457]
MNSTEPIDLTNDTDVSVTSETLPGQSSSRSSRQRHSKHRITSRPLPNDKVKEEVVILSDSDQDPNTPWIDRFLEKKQKRAPTDVKSPGSPAARRQLSKSSQPLLNSNESRGSTSTKSLSSTNGGATSDARASNVVSPVQRRPKKRESDQSSTTGQSLIASLPARESTAAEQTTASSPTRDRPSLQNKANVSASRAPMLKTASATSLTTRAPTAKRKHKDSDAEEPRVSKKRHLNDATSTASSSVAIRTTPGRASLERDDPGQQRRGSAIRTPGSITATVDGLTTNVLTARPSQAPSGLVTRTSSNAPSGSAEKQRRRSSMDSANRDRIRKSRPAILDTEPSLNSDSGHSKPFPYPSRDRKQSADASQTYSDESHNAPGAAEKEPEGVKHVRSDADIATRGRAISGQRNASDAPSVSLLATGDLMDVDLSDEQNQFDKSEAPEASIEEAVIESYENGSSMSLRSTGERSTKTGGLSTPRSRSEGPSGSPKDKSPPIGFGNGRAEDEIRALASHTSSSIDRNDARDLLLATLTPMSEDHDLSTMSGMQIELKRFLIEYRNDSRYMAVTSLSRARRLVLEKRTESDHPAHGEHIQINGLRGARHSVSPFKRMKGLQKSLEGRPTKNAVMMSLEELDAAGRKLKVAVRHVEAPTTTWVDEDEEVPSYFHCVNLKTNVLGYNQKQLWYQPYFGEKAQDEIYAKLKGFDSDSEARRTTLLRGEQSRAIREYVEAALEHIECPESAVLYHLLRPDLTGAEAVARQPSCKELFDRNALRWQRVFSKLPQPSELELSKAALVCAAFLKLANYSLWHVVRKSSLCALDEETARDELVDSLQSLACRVCHKHDCIYHGEQAESDDELGSDHDPDLTIVERLDIDWPPAINFKRNIRGPDQDRGTPAERPGMVAKNGMRSSKAYQAILQEAKREKIQERERERRGTIYDIRDYSYQFIITEDQDADAESFGNKMRYINNPEQGRKIGNVIPRIMLCNMTPRIGMYANLNIPLGQELCFDYGPEYHARLFGGKRMTKADAVRIRQSSPLESIGESAQTPSYRMRSAAHSSRLVELPDDDDELYVSTDEGEIEYGEYDEDEEEDDEDIVPKTQNRTARLKSLGSRARRVR